MKKILLCCLLLQQPACVFAQKVIELPGINKLALGEYDLTFLEQADSSYRKTYLDINVRKEAGQAPGFDVTVDSDPDYKTVSDLSSSDKPFPVSQIKATTLAGLQRYLAEHEWRIKWRAADEEGDEAKRVTYLRMFTPQLFTVQEYGFSPRKRRGLGAWNVTKQRRRQWRITHADFLNYCIVDFGNNKRIVLLIDDLGDQVGYIIPANDGNIVSNIDSRLSHTTFSQAREQAKHNYWKASASALYETLQFFDIDHFYFLRQQGHKYELVNAFGIGALPAAYDTIVYNRNFIAARSGAETILYNSLQELLPIKEIRNYHFDRTNVQLLSGKRLLHINVKGGKPFLTRMHYSVCGTVNYYHYTITTAADLYCLDIKTEFASGDVMERKIIWRNIDTSYRLSFINGTQKLERDDNSLLFGAQVIPMNWLLLEKNKQYGIYSFDVAKAYPAERELAQTDSSLSQYESADRTKWIGRTVYDTAAQVLPVVYDSIVVPDKNYSLPVRIFKGGLIGYFPLNKDVRYQSLGQQQGYYIRFELPGQRKGWLDLAGKEYPDIAEH